MTLHLPIVLLVADVDGVLLLWAFARFILSASLLGLVFLAMAYLLSSLVGEKSSAAARAGRRESRRPNTKGIRP